MENNTVFSPLLALWMDRIARFAGAKLYFPDEDASRISVSNVSNTHRSALAHFFVAKPVLSSSWGGRERPISPGWHLRGSAIERWLAVGFTKVG